MTKYLITTCPKCDEPVEAIRVDYYSQNRIGEAVQHAASLGHGIDLQEQATLGNCVCPKEETENLVSTPIPTRWTIRQLLYGTAVVGVLATIFRRPILLLFDSQDPALAYLPWHFLAWFFVGAELPGIKRGPPSGADLLLLMINLVFAAVLTICVIRIVFVTIRLGWSKISR